MKSFHFTPLALAMALFMTACSSVPTSTPTLQQARNDFAAAQNNPIVTQHAALELKQAGESLALADAAASKRESPEEVDKLAYVAKQKIALTQEVSKRKLAEADVTFAGKDRDQMLLAQRTHEANQAIASAQQSNMTARVAQADAAIANRQANMAQDATAEAQRQALEAQTRAAQLEVMLTDLAAKKTERGIIITLGDVLFGTDLARLNANGVHTIKKLAVVLQQNPQRKVLIEGFADSTGADAHNQVLSERRANAVRVALLEQGIAPERIDSRGYGEMYPVASNDTASNRKLNRRVEIVLSDDTGKIMAR